LNSLIKIESFLACGGVIQILENSQELVYFAKKVSGKICAEVWFLKIFADRTIVWGKKIAKKSLKE